jgi:hypothetical protein
MHGSVANFVGTGKYHEKSPLVAPDLSSLDPEGLGYDVKKSTYETAYKTWYSRLGTTIVYTLIQNVVSVLRGSAS